ncbi:MAG: fused MFS/spermidine synthase, partial [Planctomycetota bacterium]
MDEVSGTTTSAAPRVGTRRDWAIVVYMLFFLSGMTSLVYEVIWVKKFGLVFGVTTYAVSTVLAAFFAGLAVGSYVAGRIIDRTRIHPLLAYGVMEAMIGVYALLLPVFLRLVEATYPAVYTQIGESFSLFTLFRFVVAFALLAVPTTLMGATLPVLSKLMVDREDVLGFNVGRLYAANTFGAVAGTFAAGFLLIPTLGMATTTLTAAIGNFFLAVMAVVLSAS